MTIPFKCHKCGIEFRLPHGGRCSVCSELFCFAHLLRARTGTTNELVCLDCSKTQEGETDYEPLGSTIWPHRG